MKDLLDRCPRCSKRNTVRTTFVFEIDFRKEVLRTLVHCPDCDCHFREVWVLERVDIDTPVS